MSEEGRDQILVLEMNEEDDDDVDLDVIRDCGWSVDKMRFPFSPIGKSPNLFLLLKAFKVLSFSDSLSSVYVVRFTSVPTTKICLVLCFLRNPKQSDPV